MTAWQTRLSIEGSVTQNKTDEAFYAVGEGEWIGPIVFQMILARELLFRQQRKLAREKNKEDSSVVRESLPFKDQTSANAVKKQIRDLSHKIGRLHYNPCLSAEDWNYTSSPEKSSLQS